MRILKRSQFAGSNFHYIKHTLSFFLNSMADLDVHLVEFYMACPHLSVFDASAAEVERIRKRFAERDIALCCTTLEQCTYPINIASEDAAIRERSVATLEKAIEYTAILECPYTQVLGGRGSYDLPESEAWSRAAESLSRLAERGRRCGVTMVIEEASRYTTNTVYSTPLTRKMLDEVGSPFFKAMLDDCATETAGEDFSECLDILKGDMRHVHFADGEPGGHLIPGEGKLPLLDYLRALDDRGYEGAITFELYNRKYELDPGLYMKKCFDYIARALA
jgi:protein FrlC